MKTKDKYTYEIWICITKSIGKYQRNMKRKEFNQLSFIYILITIWKTFMTRTDPNVVIGLSSCKSDMVCVKKGEKKRKNIKSRNTAVHALPIKNIS